MAARQGPAREEKRTLGPGRTSHPISQLHDDRQLREKNFLLLSRGVSPSESRSHGCVRVWGGGGESGRLSD